MFDLSGLSLLSFEICPTCNMQKEHVECPINKRFYADTRYSLDVDIVAESIKRARKLGFKGMVAFHYYNEPLIQLNKILKIMDIVPEQDFLIWTNALLLDRDISKNKFLKRFKCVCITSYNPNDIPFFEALADEYDNIAIFDWELDDRLEIYRSTKNNILACKRPLFEIPVDYHGNIHLCCMDWNNQFKIGNIFDTPLDDIVCSNEYQKLMQQSRKRLLEDSSPEICKKCDKVWVSYPKHDDINFEKGERNG